MNDAYYNLRAKGSKKSIDDLFQRMEDKEGVRGDRYCCVRSASLSVISEGDGAVLASITGACVPTFAEAAKTLYDPDELGDLRFADIAKHLGCMMEVFVDGQRGFGGNFCEHLLADAEGNLLASEEEDIDEILQWDQDEPLGEFLEEWGFDPDEFSEDDFSSDGMLYLGATIEMYKWDERLAD